MENRNHTPHGYEWRYHLMPGQPGGRWVLCRKMSGERRARIALQATQREQRAKREREREKVPS